MVGLEELIDSIQVRISLKACHIMKKVASDWEKEDTAREDIAREKEDTSLGDKNLIQVKEEIKEEGMD